MKKSIVLCFVLLAFTSCGGARGPGAAFNAHNFIEALNNVDGVKSQVLVQPGMTLRDQYSSGQWFVIYDSKEKTYKAVSLNYLQNLYVKLNGNEILVAQQYRNDSGGTGDGVAFEELTPVYDPRGIMVGADQFHQRYDDTYYMGHSSGAFYEDSLATTDVSLQAKEKSEKKSMALAAKLSVLYNLDITSSMTMVQLGQKMEKMLSRNHGEFTENDQSALLYDIQKILGVDYEDLKNSIYHEKASKEILEKIATRIGTSPENLEQNILPVFFDIH